jgi:hypothetical protein
MDNFDLPPAVAEPPPVSQSPRCVSQAYLEDFDNGPAGWWAWSGNSSGLKALELGKSSVISRSPWWIDYNHAPPGAGYLHMVFCLCTKGPFGETMTEVAGPNGFVQGGFPRNLTNARLTFRLKGELKTRGANLVLLVQSTMDSLTSGWALIGQPLTVGREWSEQTITAVPEPDQWVCIGSRHDRRDYYGYIELKKVLSDVNCNIMLILFPLTVAPMGPLAGDKHILRPGKDYPVWRSKLPEGYVVLDSVRIAFSGKHTAQKPAP